MRLSLRFVIVLTCALLLISALSFAQGHWQARSILSIKASINAMAVGPNNNIYAATNGSGIYKSTNGGAAWTQVSSGTMPNNYYSIAVDKKNNVFAGSFEGAVFVSIDGGATWTKSLVGLGSAMVSSFSFGDSASVYAGSAGEGMFVSRDLGTTWISIGLGISYPYVTSTLIDTRRNILAGTYGSGTYISTNKGRDWDWIGLIEYPFYAGADTQLGTAPTFLRVNAMARGTGTNVMMATDQGLFYNTLIPDTVRNDSTGKLIRVDTVRSAWMIDTVGMGGKRTFVQSLVSTASGHFFAGTYGGGLFHSTNNGASWVRSDSALPAGINWRSLTIDDSGYVYAGTTTGLIYRSVTPEPVQAPEESPSMTASLPPVIPQLEQNYPNPFNPTTTIPFTLFKSGYTRLVIYDVLGREVARIVDGNLTAGKYAFQWNASAVPSGTYFYRLQSTTATQTGKLVLLK